MEDSRAYACAYRFVSARCLLLQLAATTIPLICSALQFRTACFSSSSRTFNPKVAGSNPARPMGFAGILSTDCRAERTCVRTRTRPRGDVPRRFPPAARHGLQFVSARLGLFKGILRPIARAAGVARMTRWSAITGPAGRRRRLARFIEEQRAGDGATAGALVHHERGRYCWPLGPGGIGQPGRNASRMGEVVRLIEVRGCCLPPVRFSAVGKRG
jgi:hypothetical protein